MHADGLALLMMSSNNVTGAGSGSCWIWALIGATQWCRRQSHHWNWIDLCRRVPFDLQYIHSTKLLPVSQAMMHPFVTSNGMPVMHEVCVTMLAEAFQVALTLPAHRCWKLI